jgi:CRP-like cAMP-binding protein
MLPTDIAGIEHAILGRANRDIVAASALTYRMLSAKRLRQLTANPQIAAWMLASIAETRWRADRLITALSRLRAYERVACFLLAIYDRLRRAKMIAGPTFHLHITQEQIGDHLGMTIVHVSRTLHRLREDKVVFVDRHVVIICDIDRLRAIADGLLPPMAAVDWLDETNAGGADAGPTSH